MKRPFKVRLFLTTRFKPRVRTFAAETAACAFAVEEIRKTLDGADGAYEAIVERSIMNVVARYYIHKNVIRVVRNNKDVALKE